MAWTTVPRLCDSGSYGVDTLQPIVQDGYSTPSLDALSSALFIYVSPVLVVCGSLGNALCVAVLLQPVFRTTPMGLMLTVLAVLDTFNLHFQLLVKWLLALTYPHHPMEAYLRASSTSFCRAQWFLTFFPTHLASWTVVLVTVERAMAVLRPIQVRMSARLKNVLLIFVCLIVIIFGFNSHMFYTVELQLLPAELNPYNKTNFGHCVLRENTPVLKRLSYIWRWLNVCVLSIVPFLIIIVSNSLIVHTLRRQNQTRSSLGGGAQPYPMATQYVPMMLALSTVFLITTLPLTTFLAIELSWAQNAQRMTSSQKTFFYNVVYQLYFVNSAVNFVLYCLSGSRFRQTLWGLCSRKL